MQGHTKQKDGDGGGFRFGREDRVKDRLGRWIVKEDEDKLRARILIPIEEIRQPGFETDFMWLMSSRYNIERYELIYRKIFDGAGLLTDKDVIKGIAVDPDSRGGKPGRLVSLVFHEKSVLVVIKGEPAVTGAAGEVAHIRFNHNQVPGRANPDGSMNWYELNKFIVVEPGEELCTLLDPVDGSDGINIFGGPVLPDQAAPYPLEFGDGVGIGAYLAGDRERTGMRLAARMRGVLSYTCDERGNLRSLDVEEEISTRSICFKTGNLGDREVRIPVPVFLEEFRPDFSLYSTAAVTCSEVYGGVINTDDRAVLGIVNSGSRIVAGKEIRAEFVQKSYLEAPEVSVTRNIIDVRIKADRFRAEGEKIFALTNTEVDALIVQMNQVLIQGGDNIIDLGRSLINRRASAELSGGDAEDEKHALQEEKAGLLETVKTDLLQAVKKAEPDKRKGLVEFARTMSRHPEEEIVRRLEVFKGYGNMRSIEAMKKKLLRLARLNAAIKEKNCDQERAGVTSREIGEQLQQVSYAVTGFVAPGATLRIRYDDWEREFSADRTHHLQLDVAGNMGPDGNIRIATKTCRQVLNPLSYTQVQAKDA
ncbi:MAG: FapA family protein [Desulfobacterales bacterium]|nr:FapA family protein [Desulfobacterales bacterium]